MRRLAALLVAPALLLAACGSDDKTSASDTTEACPAVPGVAPPTKTGSGKGAVLLRSVTFRADECSDRVTFRFTSKKGVVPSCTIGPESGPFTEDGSGKPVVVEGIVYQKLRCEPASGYDFETGTPTYTGPKRVERVGARRVFDIVETGDFEGVVTWVLGLANRRAVDPSDPGRPEENLELRVDTKVDGADATLVVALW